MRMLEIDVCILAGGTSNGRSASLGNDGAHGGDIGCGNVNIGNDSFATQEQRHDTESNTKV